MSRFGIQFVLGLVLLLMCSQTVSGQPLRSKPNPNDLIYRQIKVNEADLDEVLEGTVPLLRTQFDEMLNAVNRLDRQNADVLPEFRQDGSIRQAMYYGRVQGGQIIDGRAVLGVDVNKSDALCIGFHN